MNLLQTWLLFVRPERNFHLLSYKFLTISTNLEILNERRKAIQREIVCLSQNSHICQECKGACCRGDYNHFTAIDYLIRRFSDKPIEKYGILWKPESMLNIIANKLKLLFPSAIQNKLSKTKCPNLISSGCAFKPEERPMRCIIWTCKKQRISLKEKDLGKIGYLTKELYNIAEEVNHLFR